MSDDEQNSWFSAESSDSAEDQDVRGPERRLEAVPVDDEGTVDWFGQEASQGASSASGEDPKPASRDGRSKALFVGVVCAALVVIAGGALGLATLIGGAESSSEAAPLTAPPAADKPGDSAVAVSDSAECQSSTSETVTTGNGEGGTDSVEGVVLAFQHAYYVERDAEQMEPLLAKDSQITDLDALQKGIDSVARGTTHCLRISPKGESAASVELTETAPDGTENIYHQRISTAREGGEVRIVSIEDRE